MLSADIENLRRTCAELYAREMYLMLIEHLNASLADMAARARAMEACEVPQPARASKRKKRKPAGEVVLLDAYRRIGQ